MLLVLLLTTGHGMAADGSVGRGSSSIVLQVLLLTTGHGMLADGSVGRGSTSLSYRFSC